jgi:hypothetical protein
MWWPSEICITCRYPFHGDNYWAAEARDVTFSCKDRLWTYLQCMFETFLCMRRFTIMSDKCKAMGICTRGDCIDKWSKYCTQLIINGSCHHYDVFIHFPFVPNLEHRAPFRGFCDHTYKTHRRTPLEEWSARLRDLYLHRTTQHINTTDKHPCPEQDSNPRPQQLSGRRPTP